MNFLIISAYYPPWQASGSVRPAMLAKYLVKYGHECTVLTIGLNSIPQKDDNFIKMNDGIITVRVPLQVIIPYGLYTNDRKNPNFLHKVIRKLTTYWTPDVFYYWSIKAAKEYIKAPPIIPDVVFSTALPFSMHIAGSLVSKEFNATWIADFRDLWIDNPYAVMKEGLAKKLRNHQNKVLDSANLVTCISDKMSDALKKSLTGKIRLSTLANAFDDEEFRNVICNRKNNKDIFTFLYTGRLYEGYRDLVSLFEALDKLLRDFVIKNIKIRIVYAGPDGNVLLDQASKYNLQNLVVNMGFVSRRKSLELQKNADVLLLSIGKGKESDAMVVTGKVFEYFAAKRPILAFGYTEGDLAQLLNTTGAGKIFSPEDFHGISYIVENWLLEFQRTGTINYKGDYEKVMQHSWDYRIKELLSMIDNYKVAKDEY